MQDEDKTKEQLIIELKALRDRLDLEKDKGPSINATDNADELRRRAEKVVSKEQTGTDRSRTKEYTEKLLHELRVHQIELEMQNAWPAKPSYIKKKSELTARWFCSAMATVASFPILFLIVAVLFAGGVACRTCDAAAEAPEVLVGSELDFAPYAFVDDNGRPAGFSVDLIKAVADVMGLSIKISTGSWDTVWNALVSRQIDVLPIVANMPGRQDLVDFSLPHTETYDAFFMRKGDPFLQNITAARGKEIVVMRSDAAHHALLERDFQGNLVLVDTIPEGLSLVASGKHDAFLCSKLIGTLAIKRHGIVGLAAGPPIPDYKRVFSFAVKKGDTELLEKLNQGLLIVKTGGEYDRIYEKWLTAADSWPKALRTIIVDDYYPYTFVNDKGKPDGFSVDIANAVAAVMGLKLEITVDSWEHAMDAIANGAIDLLPMMASSPERQKLFDFSVPHTIGYDAVFVRNGTPRTGSMEDLTNRTIIVMNRDAAHDYLLSSGMAGRSRLVLVDSLPDGLRALSAGDGDAALMPKLVGLIVMKKLNLDNLDPSPVVIDAYRRPFSFAVKRGNQVLLERLSQGLSIIKTTGQYERIYEKWFGAVEPKGLPWRSVLIYIAGVAAVFTFIGSALFLWNVSLRKQVASRTERLEGEILERRKAEESLRESEERYRSLVENQTEVVCRFIPDGTLTFVNDAFYHFFNKSKEELIGKSWHPLPIGEDLEYIEKKLLELDPSHPTVIIENRVLTGKGEIRWIQFVNTGLFDDHGNLLEIQSVGRDITERKRAEEALRSSEEKFSKAFRDAPLLMTLSQVDDGTYIEVNEKFIEVSGFSREEAIGKTSTALGWISVEDRQRLVELLKTHGRVSGLEITLHAKDGREVCCLYSGELVAPGSLQYLLSIAQDVTDRKQADEALREKTALAQTFMDALPCVALLLKRRTREIVALNKAATEAGARLGETCFGSWPKSEKPCWFCQAPEAWETEMHQALEVETLGISWEAHWVPVAGELYLHYAFDVTDRKKAEQALLDSENKFKSFAEQALAGFYIIQDGVFKYVNPKFAEMFGYTVEELQNDMPFKYLVYPEDLPIVEEQIRRRMSGEVKTVHYTFRGEKKDGQIIHGEIYGASSVYRGKIAATGTVLDITDRKRAEEELRRLAEAVRQASEGIVITDPEGNIQYANPIFEKITGYTLEEVIGKNPRFFESGKQDQTFYKGLLDTIFAGERWAGQMVNKRKDGVLYTAECSISPVKGENGAVVNFVWITRDVTKELELEEKLRQAQKLEAIGTLAGGIAHDFNNVLSAILGYTEMALEDVSEEASARHDLLEVLKASHRARDLVQQILVFSRMKGEQERVPTKTIPIIKEAIKLLRASLPSTIEIKEAVMTAGDRVLADPTQIHQVLVNLCTNAFHAMEEKGGVLEIGLTDFVMDEKTAASHGHVEPGPYLRLSVTDSGPGMDEATLQRIFDPYFTTKEVGKGSGLGLAVVHGVVKRHQGAISVESTPGTGARFDVYLPKMQVEAMPEAQVVLPVPKGTERVLFIDDEQPLAELGKKILESLGYKVTVRTKSTEALLTFRRQPDQFDVVITDYTMPHMTGAELAKEILKARPDIPIILCTGFSESISEDRARDLGISTLIMKPLTKRVIAETVRKVLEGK